MPRLCDNKENILVHSRVAREVQADLELASLVNAIVQEVGTFVKDNQHWTTLLGFLATIVALWLTYSKMKKRVESFRDQASTEVTIANIAYTIAAVGDLLERSVRHSNSALIQTKMMYLRKLLADIRPELQLNHLGFTDEFQHLITKASLYERAITNYRHTDKKTFDNRGFLKFLLELKDFLLQVKNSIGIMSKDGHNDTK